MTYRIDVNHPRITMDPGSPVEPAVAAFLDGEGVTTQEQWATWLANADEEDMARYAKAKAGSEVTIQAVEE